MMRRRDLIRTSGVMLSAATIPGIASAKNKEKLEENPIRKRDKKSLIGSIASSDSYKIISEAMRDEGYKPHLGKATAKQIRHKEKLESVRKIEIPCKVRGNIINFGKIEVVMDPNGKIHALGTISRSSEYQTSELIKQHVTGPEIRNNSESGFHTINVHEGEQ